MNPPVLHLQGMSERASSTGLLLSVLQVAFRLKEDLGAQMLHYDVSVGAYMQLDDPRPLVQEALALLIPRPMAEEVTSQECIALCLGL